MTESKRIGFAGGIASIVSDIVYFPIDTMKNRQMASSLSKDFSKCAKGINKMKGVNLQVNNSFVYGSLFFFMYEKSKQFLGNFKYSNQNINNVISAGVAEMCADTVITPIEIMKSKIQIGLNTNLKSAFRSIYLNQGVKGFFSGYESFVLGDMTYSMINFAVYEWYKQRYHEKQNETLKMNQFLKSALISGAIASLITTPFDIIKIKQMTQPQIYSRGLLNCSYQVLRFVLNKKILKQEGLFGFFRGAQLRVSGCILMNVIYLLMYEKMLQIFSKDNKN